jgi:hypothetical protein
MKSCAIATIPGDGIGATAALVTAAVIDRIQGNPVARAAA